MNNYRTESFYCDEILQSPSLPTTLRHHQPLNVLGHVQQSQQQIGAASPLHSDSLNPVTKQNQSVARKKLEKLKAKFYELFFSSSTTSTPFQQQQQQQQTVSSHVIEPLNQSMLMSNCYYGYKSQLTNDDEVHNTNKRKDFKSKSSHKRNQEGSVFSSSSSTSSMIIDDVIMMDSTGENSNSSSGAFSHFSNSSSNSNAMIITGESLNFSNAFKLNQQQYQQQPHFYYDATSNYDTSSLNTNINYSDYSNGPIETDACNNINNPFLNSSLTSMISFNTDYNLLDSYFESSLNLIDDQDNFFNMDFMINYIAYMLLTKMRQSDALKQLNWELKTLMEQPVTGNSSNLLKDIARDIYLESENEPCGLKGCNIAIFIETIDPTQQVDDESQLATQTNLLTQFRFDSTCSLTTFELNLVVKQDRTHIIFNSNQSSTTTSSIATLTRRLFAPSTKHQTDNQQQQQRTVYLDSTKYDLFKRKLY